MDINPWAEHDEHDHERYEYQHDEHDDEHDYEHDDEQHEITTRSAVDVQALLDALQLAWPPPSPPPNPDPDPVLLLHHLDDDHPPVAVQWAATATAKALHDALARTRHLPLATSSPLSRLLASRGSLQWQSTRQDPVPDTTHVGWRILDKDDQPKPKKPAGGLLSFWTKRSSTDPAASSARSSVSLDEPPSRAASPTKPSVPPPPSAMSRFLDRFSRPKSSSQNTVLALSSDDLEFLSDIVPSATSDSLATDDFLTPLPSATLPSATPLLNTPIPPTLAPPPPSNLASFPPLLPPPPPHTPRHVLDDEFTEFASFPPLRSPSPPSPPPRRTYERTHYPTSSSASSSTFSPTSHSSTTSSFDDFMSAPPPPLPAKSLSIFTSPVTSVDRQRTQALVDHAAAHSGMWPNSPVSPQPTPLDLLGTGDSLLSHHLRTPPATPLQPTPPSFSPRPIQPKQTGGLSAQDLSFFESL